MYEVQMKKVGISTNNLVYEFMRNQNIENIFIHEGDLPIDSSAKFCKIDHSSLLQKIKTITRMWKYFGFRRIQYGPYVLSRTMKVGLLLSFTRGMIKISEERIHNKNHNVLDYDQLIEGVKKKELVLTGKKIFIGQPYTDLVTINSDYLKIKRKYYEIVKSLGVDCYIKHPKENVDYRIMSAIEIMSLDEPLEFYDISIEHQDAVVYTIDSQGVYSFDGYNIIFCTLNNLSYDFKKRQEDIITNMKNSSVSVISLDG